MHGVIDEPKQKKLTFDTTPTTGSTNPVTSGGVADAIAQSTASCVQTTYTNYTLAANARTYVYPTAPTVSHGHSAYLVAAQLSVNSNGVIFQGINSSSRSALFYNTLSSALSGSDFPLYCTWMILPTA